MSKFLKLKISNFCLVLVFWVFKFYFISKMNLNDIFAEATNTMKTLAKKSETPEDIRLSTKKLLNMEKELLQYIDIALLKYLDYFPANVLKFSKTLKAYLEHLVIVNEKIF